MESRPPQAFLLPWWAKEKLEAAGALKFKTFALHCICLGVEKALVAAAGHVIPRPVGGVGGGGFLEVLGALGPS